MSTVQSGKLLKLLMAGVSCTVGRANMYLLLLMCHGTRAKKLTQVTQHTDRRCLFTHLRVKDTGWQEINDNSPETENRSKGPLRRW